MSQPGGQPNCNPQYPARPPTVTPLTIPELLSLTLDGQGTLPRTRTVLLRMPDGGAIEICDQLGEIDGHEAYGPAAPPPPAPGN